MLTSSTSSSPYAQRQRNPRKHLANIALVVALHVLLLWALQSGLAQKVMKISEVKVVAMLLSESVPQPPAPPQASPPPPPPKVPPPPAAAVAPTPTSTTPTITVPAAPPSQAAVVPAPSAPPAPAAAPVPAIRTGATIKAGASCAKPDYPSASLRFEEEGTVTLKFLIGIDGQVLQAEIEKSSGFTRLDEAARNALSKCQFRPATVDGKPEQSSVSMKYIWRI